MGHGVVGNLVTGDVPVGDIAIVGVVERGEVGHEDWAAIGVLALREELVYGVERVGLYCVVCSEGNELRHISAWRRA